MMILFKARERSVTLFLFGEKEKRNDDKKMIAMLLSALLLFSAFPLTAFAEDDEPREPVQISWLYSQSSGAQAQGGELPHGFMLDDDNPSVTLRFPPMRAPGKRFLGWNGLPVQAQTQSDGFTVLELNRDDFTVNEDGSITSPYSFSTYLTARYGNGYSFTGWVDNNGSAVTSLDSLTPDSVSGGCNYALTAKRQRLNGFDYQFDENTKTLTIDTDTGMKQFPEEMTETQLKSVEKIVMTAGVTSLYTNYRGFRFSDLTALRSLTISPSINMIYSNYFSGMPSLEEVSIPASVLNIRNDAFADCSKLATVTFADNDASPITVRETLSIENNAFKNCAVETVRFPKQLQKLGTGILSGGWYGKGNIRIAAMETVTDEATGVKLGNLGGASFTVTTLDTTEISRAETLLNKITKYKDYICAFGYEIKVDPSLTAPLTVLVPGAASTVAFTCTDGDGVIDINDATHLQMFLAEYPVVLGKQP